MVNVEQISEKKQDMSRWVDTNQWIGPGQPKRKNEIIHSKQWHRPSSITAYQSTLRLANKRGKWNFDHSLRHKKLSGKQLKCFLKLVSYGWNDRAIKLNLLTSNVQYSQEGLLTTHFNSDKQLWSVRICNKKRSNQLSELISLRDSELVK